MPPPAAQPKAKDKGKAAAKQLAKIQDTAARRIQRASREFLPKCRIMRDLALSRAPQEVVVDTYSVLREAADRQLVRNREMRQPGYVGRVATVRGEPLSLPPRPRSTTGKSKFEIMLMEGSDMKDWPNDYELVGEIVRRAEAKRILRERAERAEGRLAERRVKRSWRQLSQQTPSQTPSTSPSRKVAPPATPSVSSDDTDDHSNSGAAPAVAPSPPAAGDAVNVVELEA